MPAPTTPPPDKALIRRHLTVEELKEDMLILHAMAMRNVATELANGTHRPGELTDIYVALGQLNTLMASLAFDLGKWGATARMARAATTYAEMAGYTSLQAWAAGHA